MKLETLALKVLGFFAFVFAFWKWGKTSALLREAEKRSDEAIENNIKIAENNAMPYVDDPAMCLYDISEDDISEDEKEISN